MGTKTFTPPVAPSPGTSRENKVKKLVAEFGDGYSLEVPDGINNVKQGISVTWDFLTPQQAKDISSFFEETKGTDFFFWRPSDREDFGKWTCSDWKDETIDSGFKKIAAKFDQRFFAPNIGNYSRSLGEAAYNKSVKSKAGEASYTVDFTVGGMSVFDGAGSEFTSIEQAEGITISTPSGYAISADKKIKSYPANSLRYDWDINGFSRGVIFDQSTIYHNSKLQPAVADLSTATNISDTSVSGETGNWLRITTPGLVPSAYRSDFTPVAAGVYAIMFEVIMDDGSAPVIGATQGVGDFSVRFGGSISCKKQSDGSAGADVIGPFANNKYLVLCYFDNATYANSLYGFNRFTGQGTKNFSIGRYIITDGYRSTQFFDNATSTEVTRAADNLSYTLPKPEELDEFTLIANFICPFIRTGNQILFQIRDTANNAFFYVYLAASSTTLVLRNIYNGSVQTTRSVVGCVEDKEYKLVYTFSRKAGLSCVKVSEIGYFENTFTPELVITPVADTMYFGRWSGGTGQWGGNIKSLQFIKRALTKEEIDAIIPN